MVQLRGLLRRKLSNLGLKEEKRYPHFYIREPKLFPVLPSFKRMSNVNITYPLLEPFVSAEIKWNKKKKSLTYKVVEPSMDKKEWEKYKKIEEMLTEIIDIKMSVVKMRKNIDYLEKKVRRLIKTTKMDVDKEEFMKIMYYIFRNFVGLNEIEPLMHDPYIEDIGCSGLNTPVFIVHRRFGSLETNIVFTDFEYLNNFVIKLSERCGRYISYATPLLDGSLPDGSRVQASMAKDVTTKGPTFSIRKFRRNPFSPIDLINLKTVSSKMMSYLWFAVEHGASILICGGVASGKTSMLNCLSIFIPPEHKIISIEDVREINIPHENWIPAVTRTGFGIPEKGGKRYGEINLFDLLKESFRMKPDYVIVGEIRGKEAYVMFQGISSGHPSLGTIHAGSVDDVMKRLSTPPIELSPSLLESLDMVIVMVNAKEKGKSARRVKSIVEIQSVDPETKKALTITTFGWIPFSDDFKENITRSEVLRRISFETGISYQKIMEELDDRKRVLEWMLKYEIFHFEDVYALINLYYKDKASVMKMVERDIPPYKGKMKKHFRRIESVTGLKIWK